MKDNEIICTHCVLTAKTPGIEFDQNGVCNYCREHVPIKTSPEDVFSEIIKRFDDRYRN